MSMLQKPRSIGLEDLHYLHYPIEAEIKYNGVCGVSAAFSGLMTRTFKPFPNEELNALLRPFRQHLAGLVFELVVGSMESETSWNETVSYVMSKNAKLGSRRLHVILFDDYTDLKQSYTDRMAAIGRRMWMANSLQSALNSTKELLHFCMPQTLTCYSPQDVLDFFNWSQREHYEGLMLKAPDAKYKQGRCPPSSFDYLRLKAYETVECEVVAVLEEWENLNDQIRAEDGRMKRSSMSDLKVPKGRAGALVVRHPTGFTFSVSSGLDDIAKANYWDFRHAVEQLQPVYVRYSLAEFKQTGVPKSAVYLGVRDIERGD